MLIQHAAPTDEGPEIRSIHSKCQKKNYGVTDLRMPLIKGNSPKKRLQMLNSQNQ